MGEACGSHMQHRDREGRWHLTMVSNTSRHVDTIWGCIMPCWPEGSSCCIGVYLESYTRETRFLRRREEEESNLINVKT